MMMSSRSQSWRSFSTMAGSFSDSAESSAWLGASRAIRSFRIPPGMLLSVSLPQGKRLRQPGLTVGRVGHCVCVCAALKDERCIEKKVFPGREQGKRKRKRSSRRSWSRTNTKVSAVYCRDGRGGRGSLYGPYVTRQGPLQRARMVETGADEQRRALAGSTIRKRLRRLG